MISLDNAMTINWRVITSNSIVLKIFFIVSQKAINKNT
jgi:hypothetical protein